MPPRLSWNYASSCARIRPIRSVLSGAPVGFVNVRESKHMLKSFTHLPKLVIEGRKGGSNLAATLVNAILCFDDAAQLRPGTTFEELKIENENAKDYYPPLGSPLGTGGETNARKRLNASM